ncbi:MAG: hypothetical protein JWN04_2471 [Myxococcaceae bacterium]|nr:hypothetical protein [Myxococcaceae bacterium]
MNTQVELIACSTCGSSERDAEGRTRGERLLLQLQAARDASEHRAVALSSTRCLWLCKRSCAVHLRSEGRVGYLLAELDESSETARGLLDYASLYAGSSDGAVPFKQWPQAVRGHFVSRIPAAPSASVETLDGAQQTASKE